MEAPNRKPTLTKVPVYEVRLVQSRRPLRLAEAEITDGELASRTLHAMFGKADREYFAMLFLDGRSRITGAHTVAVGGQHGVMVEARMVFRAAIAACASCLVLGHNHPSGDPTPSKEDLNTTARLMAGADVLGIPILDHVIVTRDPHRWHSMLSSGTFPKASAKR